MNIIYFVAQTRADDGKPFIRKAIDSRMFYARDDAERFARTCGVIPRPQVYAVRVEHINEDDENA